MTDEAGQEDELPDWWVDPDLAIGEIGWMEQYEQAKKALAGLRHIYQNTPGMDALMVLINEYPLEHLKWLVLAATSDLKWAQRGLDGGPRSEG